MIPPPPTSTLFPYTTLFRSASPVAGSTSPFENPNGSNHSRPQKSPLSAESAIASSSVSAMTTSRSEEHTSELQSPEHLVCRLLLEKKKKTTSRLSPLKKTSE